MSIYQTVTDRILKELEAGVIPWRKTWTTGLPKSLTTGRDYRGVNILVLGTAPFSSRYWVTYREAQRLGGHVRKGERASPVVYWKWRTYEEMKQLAEQQKGNIAPCVPFASAVFNLDQVEGVPRPSDDLPPDKDRRLELAENLVAGMPDKPQIAHRLIENPSYSPLQDCVTLPHLSQFENAEAYYSVLYHELCHASGHPKRLNRFGVAEGTQLERYSFEELVAEFGAAFLCALTGVSNPASDALQASYIKGWSEALRRDQRLVIRAASAAQRAVDFIRGTRHPEPVATDD